MTTDFNTGATGARSARPLGELVGGLAADFSNLFRKEIELAKTEASEKLDSVVGGVELLIAGAVIGIGAIGVLFAAIVTALATLFVSWGMDRTGANSLAAFIVFVIAAIIAWVLVARGRAAVSAANLRLERTTSSLARDAAAVKEKL
ncbi:MAG: phage holin family protein [Devosia sp.]|jgi:hypothetical protein|nr:phage holin family protein [Devosiaceae bacterium]